MNREMIILIYVSVVSIITFMTFGIDKYKARYHHWRISERMLILLVVFGGSTGALLAMLIFHHKTKKPLFKYGVPIILLIQIILLIKI